MEQLLSDLLEYVPRALGALLIVAVGFVLGRLARPATTFLLRRLRFDSACDRIGLTSLMRQGGIRSSPSQFAGTVVFYAIVLFSVLAALGPLGLTFLAGTLNQVVLYAPRVLVAVLILVLGTSAAGVLGQLTRRALSEAGVRRTAGIASAVRFAVIFVAAVLAAGVLGIEATVLIVVTVVVLGGVVLTASLALGLGLRRISENVAAKRYITEGVAEGDEISVGGVSGRVERIGYAMTTLRDPATGRVYLVPNSHFLEHTVEKLPGGEP